MSFRIGLPIVKFWVFGFAKNICEQIKKRTAETNSQNEMNNENNSPRVDYAGYSIEALQNFVFRYVENRKHVDYFFDLGGGKGNGIILYPQPTSQSKGLLPGDVSRAFDRVVAHLKSVGYDVAISE
ncbi:hypothetical protein [Prosthecobacter sp.]|uniref:hypothetical protein n=1 Tax=Prosthecobacter sp. TaxID=1965333 RepID=UPI003783452F